MFEQVTDLLESISDDRINEYFLVSSPKPTIVLIILYLITVKLILPAYMRNRPPYKLDTAIYYYNVFQIILSACIVYLGFGSGWVRRFSVFQCRDLDRSTTDPDAIMSMNAVYLYFLAKFTEFPDTIVFILRKKYNQVSFLHLYHHATMPLNGWFMVKLVPGGPNSLAAAVNSSVHVVMYSYYFMSALGPKWQKYLWWKKYLTAFQLVQFSFGIFHMFLAMFGGCPTLEVYRPLFTAYLLYIVSLLFLFAKFYHDSYNKKSGK